MALPKLFRVAFRGQTYELAQLSESSQVHELQEALSDLTGLDPTTMKIFLPGIKGFIQLQEVSGQSLGEAGGQPAMQISMAP